MFQRLLSHLQVPRKSLSRLGAAGKWSPNTPKFPQNRKENPPANDLGNSYLRFLRTIVLGYNLAFSSFVVCTKRLSRALKKKIQFVLNPHSAFCIFPLPKLQDLGGSKRGSWALSVALGFVHALSRPIYRFNTRKDSSTKGSWETEFV